MPELPEVETIKLGLQEHLVGHVIEDVRVNIPKLFTGSPKQILGAKIIGIKRIGKGLILELDNDFALVIHLKMTGQLIYQDEQNNNLSLSPRVGGATLPSKYTHIIFSLDQHAYLYYNDLRQFGYIKVIKKEDLDKMPFFQEMGPEPKVGTDLAGKELTLAYFQSILQKSTLPIKVLLMDQKKIGGIGNIYANDCLFAAKIDPRRKAKQITPVEVNRLYQAIFTVLQKSLVYGGSSDENFVNALGQDGSYQQHTLVYGKAKQNCPSCGNKIQKIKLGGRGTFFCSNCQQ